MMCERCGDDGTHGVTRFMGVTASYCDTCGYAGLAANGKEVYIRPARAGNESVPTHPVQHPVHRPIHMDAVRIEPLPGGVSIACDEMLCTKAVMMAREESSTAEETAETVRAHGWTASLAGGSADRYVVARCPEHAQNVSIVRPR